MAIAAAALVGALAVPVIALRDPGRPRLLRIATGTRGGTFLPLGQTLAEGWQRDLRGTRFEALESAGGVASIEMLEDGRADLALLSNHVQGTPRVRLVAPLYAETLQIVVRRAAGIATPFDLRTKRVSTGAEGSGTETIAEEVLGHFGIDPDRALSRQRLGMADAAAALERGELDAAFMVAGMRTPAVDRLLRRDDMELLSLGEPGRVGSALEGIQLDAPYFAVTTIPERAYGRQPERPIGTIGVRALLVVRDDVDEDTVYRLTESLFEHKVELSARNELLAHLTEQFDLALSPYPLHAGADRYYRRSEPTFVQRYTDQISLALTVGALVWSALTALAAARRQRSRNRIEHRYGVAHALAQKARAAEDHDTLVALRAELVDMRERALADLAAEQLDPNEAFVILQDYLSAQIAELERRIDAERGASLRGSA